MRRLLPPPGKPLLFTEGLAIGTLVHGGVCLVGTDLDTVQRAVVFGVTMVGALLDSAGDALIGVGVHSFTSFLLDYGFIVCLFQKFIHAVAFWKNL